VQAEQRAASMVIERKTAHAAQREATTRMLEHEAQARLV
jgi:hypothetical protein